MPSPRCTTNCGRGSNRETRRARMPETTASGARLDAELVRRGLARSRAVAVAAISEGLVTVDGEPARKPALQVRPDAVLEIAGADHYVSRGAHKLIAALDAFGVDPAGRVALDAGASTGGFSQVLLERGAAHVLAVDVGHGQLVRQIQDSERVTSIEGFNIRDISQEWLRSALPTPEFPTLVVADLSFISLTMVLGPLRDAVGADADFVVRIKPQ